MSAKNQRQVLLRAHRKISRDTNQTFGPRPQTLGPFAVKKANSILISRIIDYLTLVLVGERMHQSSGELHARRFGVGEQGILVETVSGFVVSK